MTNVFLVKTSFPQKLYELWMELEWLNHSLISKYIIPNWFVGEDISPKYDALSVYTDSAHTEADGPQPK